MWCKKLEYANLSKVRDVLGNAFLESGLKTVAFPSVTNLEINSLSSFNLSDEIIVPDSVKEIRRRSIGISYTEDVVVIIGNGVEKIEKYAIHRKPTEIDLENNNDRGYLEIKFNCKDIKEIDKEALAHSGVNRIECSDAIKDKLINICKVDRRIIFSTD